MLILAHRGASKYAPENTLPAFRKAIELEVDGVELDIQLTKDKVPVVLHSDKLTELTTTYLFAHATPLRALKTIDAGSPFSPAFAGERIPALDEVLALLAGHARAHPSFCINLELKAQPYWHFGMEDRVVAVVRAHRLAGQILFSSFSPLVLWRLKRLAPEIPRALLIEPRAFFFLRMSFFGTIATITNLHPFHETTTPDLVRQARQRGWKIICWTVNTRTEISRAVALGVDGIITDDPVLAREVMEQTTNAV
ncbi:MAG: hypothetical protein HYV03_05970 [Deltaproteobacteria bacterium]|nr:hypothetical protein [Deltaproteobacteria bacterium]